MAILDKHKILETNATLLLICSFLVVTIGGLVQITPLFYLENTIEEVEGMRPYTPSNWRGVTSTSVKGATSVTVR